MPDLSSALVPLYGRDLAYLPDDSIVGQIPGTAQVGRGSSLATLTPFPYPRGCSCVAGRYAHLDTPGGGLFDLFSGRYLTLTTDGIDGTVAGLVADYGAARGIPGIDGTVMLARNFQTGGLRLACPDGTNTDIPEATFADYRQAGVLDKTRALWRNSSGQIVTSGGLPVPQLLPGPTYYLQPLLLNSQLWIGYLTATGFAVLHPFTSFVGYSVGQGFYPRFRSSGGTVVGIVLAASAADDPAGPVETIDVASTPTIDLNPPPAAVTFTFSHPVMPAIFKDPSGQTAAPVEIVVNQGAQSADRAYLVAEDSLAGPFVGMRLGIYTENVDPSNAIAIASASSPPTRVVACHDAPAVFPAATLAKLRPFDIPMLECYLVVGETATAAATRWTENAVALLQAWPGDVGFDLMFYCEGGAPPNETFTVGQVLDALRQVSAVVNLSPRIKLLACFEYLRANGITGHPELLQALGTLLSAATIAGLPILTPPSKPRPTPKPNLPATITPLTTKGNPMTFNCTTVDPAGAPVVGILISASVMETGQIFQRSSDGNGYSNLALEGVPSSGKNVLLSVLKEGYQVWTQAFPITPTDQAVRITLTPFA